MPRIAYVEKNFHDSTKLTIKRAMDIIDEYEEQGFSLTLRQLYYQFVARDFIPNKQKEYNRLGTIISDARLAGYIDWYAIEDRTRNLRGLRHWEDPAAVIKNGAENYRIDKWENQPVYIEVWIEKDALVGVLQRVCHELDLNYFSCRGYVSASEMWTASQRLGRQKYLWEKDRVVVLHLGDHDPSGIDMTRDIELRLNEYAVPPDERPGDTPEAWADPEWAYYYRENEWPIQVKRIALNMPQIRELEPPPNPAKVTDSRFDGYLKKYGHQSWELDALEPAYISELIKNEVAQLRDDEIWRADVSRETSEKAGLQKIANHYEEVVEFVERLSDEES